MFRFSSVHTGGCVRQQQLRRIAEALDRSVDWIVRLPNPIEFWIGDPRFWDLSGLSTHPTTTISSPKAGRVFETQYHFQLELPHERLNATLKAQQVRPGASDGAASK